jgi:hypothetical protein
MPAAATTVEASPTAMEASEATPSVKSSVPEAAPGEMVPSVVPRVITAAVSVYSTEIRTGVAVVGTVISIVRAGVGVIAAVRSVTHTTRIHGTAV